MHDVRPCLLRRFLVQRMRVRVTAAGETVGAGAATQSPRRGVVHVLDEKLMYLAWRAESCACIPGAHERPLDDLRNERPRILAQIGARFRSQRGEFLEEDAAKRLLVF